MPRACGSVRPAAREDHGDQAGTEDTGRALEQDVDRGRDGTGPSRSQPELAVADVDEPVRGNDEDDAVLQRLPLLNHSHRKRRVSRENLVQMAWASGIEVLGYHDRRGEVGRQTRHEA